MTTLIIPMILEAKLTFRPVAVFLVAPIPNAIFSNLNANYQSDFLSDSAPNGNPFKDFGEFVTGIFVFSGLVLPIVFWHVQLIVFWSMIMSLSGGFIVYASIILFSMFFHMSDDDEGFDF